MFWKRLNCSLKNATIIIEGSVQLHNYLVNYRDIKKDIQQLTCKRDLLQEDVNNSHATTVQTGTDLHRPQGSIRNDERMNRLKGMVIRDDLRQSLVDHDMYRKTKHWIHILVRTRIL